MARRTGRPGARGLWLALALLAACTVSPTVEDAANPTAAGYPAPGAEPTQALPPAGYPGEPGTWEALVTAAVADLAQRAGVDATAIQVVEVTPQSWPDASLGCPIEGQLYAQVVTEGYRIVLEAAGRRYAYHTDLATAAYCEQDQA